VRAMKPGPESLIDAAWLTLVVYWLLTSLRVNKMRQREPAGEYLGRVLVMAAALVLLYSSDQRFGILNERFVPQLSWLVQAAAALTWAGMAIAIWARYHIGRYWSATVALRAGHELIRSGPYARIRHPIYTGMLVMVGGTALAVGRYRGLAAFAIILLAITWKAKKEEALLVGQFGSAFDDYRRHAGFFLPRFS
jgi:protein-S-isoprenylcysteine O-methyltransferase Ste14